LTPENESTIGEGASLEVSSSACVARQRLYGLIREALPNFLKLAYSLLTQGKLTEQVLEVMMPS